MQKEILFEERQRFRQWWLWAMMIGVNGIFIYGVIKQIFMEQQFGDKPMSNAGLLLTFQLTCIVTLLLVSIRLDTQIKSDGIYVRFFPFHFILFKFYSWEKIEKAYVREYSPIGEYGGWGIRLGLFGKGMAYNISGNKGIQLEMKNGKKLLIGTKHPDEAKQALQNSGHLEE